MHTGCSGGDDVVVDAIADIGDLIGRNARGFDHFYGHLNDDIHYFTHLHMGGLDWQRNGKSVEEDGYSTTLLANEAAKWIRERDKTRPFFLYLPFNAVHTPTWCQIYS